MGGNVCLHRASLAHVFPSSSSLLSPLFSSITLHLLPSLPFPFLFCPSLSLFSIILCLPFFSFLPSLSFITAFLLPHSLSPISSLSSSQYISSFVAGALNICIVSLSLSFAFFFFLFLLFPSSHDIRHTNGQLFKYRLRHTVPVFTPANQLPCTEKMTNIPPSLSPPLDLQTSFPPLPSLLPPHLALPLPPTRSFCFSP